MSTGTNTVIASFGVGLVFGLGLAVSQMISPLKILSFLDIAGHWDPSLLVVMAGAVAVTFLGYRLAMRQPHSLLGGSFHLPTRTDIDGRLVAGAVLFGIGWGLGGYCPGPALTALGLGEPKTLVFVVAMITGMLTFNLVNNTILSRSTASEAK